MNQGRRRRRFWQFRLRTLLLGVALLAVVLGRVGYYVNRSKHELGFAEYVKQVGDDIPFPEKPQVYFSHRYSAEGQFTNDEPPGPPFLREWLGENFFATVGYVRLEIVHPPDGTMDGWRFADDRDLRRLQVLSELRQLDISGTCITDEGIRLLAGHRSLRSLKLRETEVSDVGVATIATLPELRHLDLTATLITDQALCDLVQLEQLESLNLSSTHVSSACGEPLSMMASLTRLNLCATVADDSTLRAISSLGSLASLHVGMTSVSDAGIAELQSLRMLRDITLYCTRITDDGVELLSHIQTLEAVDVGKNSITDEAVSHLARLPRLRCLYLDATAITDAALASLRENGRSLEFLTLAITGVTDDGLKHLSDLPNLRHVRISGCDISDEGLANLASCRSLAWVEAFATKVTDKGLEEFHRQRTELGLAPVFVNIDSPGQQNEELFFLFPGDGENLCPYAPYPPGAEVERPLQSNSWRPSASE